MVLDSDSGTESVSPEEPSPSEGQTERVNPEDSLDVSSTGFAPSFHAVQKDAPPLPNPKGRKAGIKFPKVDEVIDDFKILQILGEGAFGVVYLAEQLSLGRKVALKITSDRGEEARTMASLEHENIVRVFSETRDSEQGFRLICMQYIPGPTLAEVIEYLNRHNPKEWSGKLFIQAIDELSKGSTTLDPVALRDREYLRQADFPTVVAWIGARLAEALEVAHSNRVLHRDIKPANILLNQYGRPLLADFSLSFQTEKIEAGSDVLFGGTLAYMAPEHLEAFNPSHPTESDRVDERSDLYSLAIVLFEFLSGKRAFEPKRTGADRIEELNLLTEERKKGLPDLPAHLKNQELELHRSLLRAASGDPRKRYSTSLEFAKSLEGGIVSRTTQQKFPKDNWLIRWGQDKPYLGFFLLAVLPHFFGSVVNISYNALRITGGLEEAQKDAFFKLVLIYNSLVYPICLGLLIWLIHRLMKVHQSLKDTDDFVDIRGRSVRSQILLLPKRAAALACIGWLPGAIFFPLGIDMIAGPIRSEVYFHFGISFTISGVIALTYSFLGLACLSLGSFYPRMWPEPGEFPHSVNEELKSEIAWLNFFKILAGLIPLAAVLVLIWVSELGVDQDSNSDFQFRILAAALIVLSGIGFQFADRIVSRLSNKIQILRAGGD